MNYKEKYQPYIHETLDFPISGVLFRDVSPLLADAKMFAEAIRDFCSLYDMSQVDAFVGIESRGFIFAAAMAAYTGKGFIPLRKAGKLPPPVFQSKYALEYGEAILEVKAGNGQVVIIDDVLATGGTLQAGIELCTKAGYQVVDVGVFVDLAFLNQMKFSNKPVKSLIQF